MSAVKRLQYKKIFFLALFLFFLFTLPPFCVEKLRGHSIGTLRPFFKGLLKLNFFSDTKIKTLETEKAKLQSENHLLRLEMEKLKSVVDQQDLISELKVDFGRVIAARVIYRDPGTYSRTLWINVGEEKNQQLKKPFIEKNCPVLFGKSVVGVIDQVGKKESRVKLLTDSALKPSVRAFRAGQNSLPQKGEGWYLAKGIVHGSGAPLWRSLNHRLKGTGFNYDFEDEKGVAPKGIPLIEVGDLLITTGMDGIFPPGLKVGFVSKVAPLREGAYTYDIEAIPSAGNMQELHTLFVIPKYSDVKEHDESRKAK